MLLVAATAVMGAAAKVRAAIEPVMAMVRDFIGVSFRRGFGAVTSGAIRLMPRSMNPAVKSGVSGGSKPAYRAARRGCRYAAQPRGRQTRDDPVVSTNPVLLCFDGSEDAAAAIVAGGEMLAPRMAVVLTVWEPVASWAHYDPATILSAPLSKLASNAVGLDEAVRDLARKHLEHGIELATQAGFQVEGRRLEEGKPWRMICQVGEALGAEPIVVGARGLGRVESALLGGVSTAVVFHAKRAVLVVPHNEHNRTLETSAE